TVLVLALALAVACIFELGVIIGHNQRTVPPATESPDTSTAATPSTPSPTVVRSGYGFSFTADSQTFQVSASQLDAKGRPQPVSSDQLHAGLPLTSAVVQAKPGAVSGRLAATQFSVTVNPDPGALSAAEKQPANAGLSAGQVAAKLLPLNVGSEVTAKTLSSRADTLNNVPVQKTTYQFTGTHGGGTSYAVQWSGSVKGRAFSVVVNGLVGSPAVPGEFAAVLDSLTISADQAVLGASTGAAATDSDSVFAPPTASADGTLDSKYLSDALSPAVVRIFHTVCGTLIVGGQALGNSSCISFSGSGFLATASGYIATNGHVVVYTAKDALADLVTSNDTVLQEYLQGLGLTPDQIAAVKSDPASLAALIARIYDLPDSQLHFDNPGELTLVTLGSDQPDLEKLVSITDSSQLAQFAHDTTSIKQARIVAYNYNPKDSLTAVADPKTGFSSSDVALLKVNVQNAPALPIETGQVLQNEPIVVMGFPGDADNELTDNQQTDVSVTDGVVSSIRQAAGGHGTLYQSDADAGHGNSGGPAIDDSGRVIGLLTYRYADTDSGDAATSYIRDIADFTALAANNGVTIDSRSSTQAAWEQGLERYSHSHYSAALTDFQKVQAAYPAQRLVGSYISSAKAAIAAGKDVKDVPVGLVIIILILALGGAAVAAVVMVRHHALHRVYQTSVPGAPNPKPVYLAKPPAAQVVSPAAQQSQPPQPPTQPPVSPPDRLQ
ncbi:MAG TPA: serine protease, partial [Candidatus Saccharimonadales bacterium]|nr:serine protease [Candidatus Saccharimonadales bacterium]